MLLLLLAGFSPNPPEAGQWLTQDRTSVIALAPCGSGLCGRIAGISLDHPTDPMPRDKWGALQCHQIIIRMPTRGKDGRWWGTIFDPRSGATWRAEIWRQGNTLRLRGYIGIPIFGATQSWTPYPAKLADNCLFQRS